MRKRILLLCIFVAALCAVWAAGKWRVRLPARSPRQLAGAGDGFTPEQVRAIRDAGDTPAAVVRTRAFGWSLLEQYAAGGGSPDHPMPLWEKWSGKCSFDPAMSHFCDSSTPLIQSAIQAPSGGGEPLLSTVFYNDKVAHWIRTNALQQATALQAFMDRKLDSVPPAPEDAVVVKEIWQGFNLVQKPDTWRLHVYDPDGRIVATNGTLPRVRRWIPKIAIKRVKTGGRYDIDANAKCEDRDYRANASVNNADDPVPIGCFVYKRSDGPCSGLVRLTGVTPPPGDLLDNEPCIVVLMGVQIATKMLENWTWSTYWWTNKISAQGTEGRDASKLPASFHHFAMDTYLSPDGVAANDHTARAIYNPYLEGPQPSGTKTNCMSCHALAAFVPACAVGTAGCIGPRVGVAAPENRPNQLCPADPSGHVQGKCVRTAFLWSIATNQDENSEVPLRFELPHPLANMH